MPLPPRRDLRARAGQLAKLMLLRPVEPAAPGAWSAFSVSIGKAVSSRVARSHLGTRDPESAGGARGGKVPGVWPGHGGGSLRSLRRCAPGGGLPHRPGACPGAARAALPRGGRGGEAGGPQGASLRAPAERRAARCLRAGVRAAARAAAPAHPPLHPWIHRGLWRPHAHVPGAGVDLGRSLAAELEQRRFTEEEVRGIAEEVLEDPRLPAPAVPKVLHRDIKPANLVRGVDEGWCWWTLERRASSPGSRRTVRRWWGRSGTCRPSSSVARWTSGAICTRSAPR